MRRWSGAVETVAAAAKLWASFAAPRLRGSVSCKAVASELPRILEGGLPATAPVRSHVEACLACQAEVARYRRLLRLLRQLAGEVEPPAGLVADVLAAVSGAAERRIIRSAVSGRRLASAGAVVLGAAAAGMVALARAHARQVVPAGAGAIVMVPGMFGAQPRGGRERPRRGQ